MAASKRSGIPSKGKVGSPAPTNRYSPTELGPDDMDYFEPGYEPDGHDSGDGGDDDGGNGGGGPPTPPEPNKKPEGDKNSKLPIKNKGGSGPPDGDDGNGDDPNDDDEKN